MVDLSVVKDLVDHMMTDTPISTEPAQAKSKSAAHKKMKRKAPHLAKDQTQSDKEDVMELTFELTNCESFLTLVGTTKDSDGETKYIYKKADKKSKVVPTTQQAVTQVAADHATTQTLIPSTTVPSATPTTQTTDPSVDSNTEEIDIAQYIEDFKKKMMENMDDNDLLKIMCHNFFSILMNTVAKKPISGSLAGKLNAIQVMANALRAKEDTQTDKEALLSYLNTRSSAKNYLKRALVMKEDNTKSVEDLLDMFMDKLKK